jgi:hypothetical protein
MGTLTDIVVARVEDAGAVAAASVPCEAFPGFEARGVDVVKLGTLYALLTGQAYDEGFSGRMPLLGGDEREGPWVTALPSDLTDLLALLEELRVAQVAAAWAATEEFLLDRVDPEVVRHLLESLVRYAREAKSGDASLLMWESL